MQILAETQYLVVDHIVFTDQTEDEVTTVMAYIDDNFEIKQIIEDQFRQIKVYQRQTSKWIFCSGK